MKSLITSASLLAATLTAPASAATDGTPGTTSTGTFNVSATMSLPPAVNVHVFGLDDFSFTGTVGVPLDGQSDRFCAIRDNGGFVGLTISSSDAADTDFRVKTPDGTSTIVFGVIVDTTAGTMIEMEEGVESQFIAAGECVDNGIDGWLMSFVPIGYGGPGDGSFSNQFIVTVSPK